MNKRKLVSLDQNHKHGFLLINNSCGIQWKAWRDPQVLLQQIYFCLMICFQFLINLIKT